jgi:hypothetical protein
MTQASYTLRKKDYLQAITTMQATGNFCRRMACSTREHMRRSVVCGDARFHTLPLVLSVLGIRGTAAEEQERRPGACW